MALSDKTKETLKTIAETAAKGIDITGDIVDLLTPFVPDAAKYPKDILEGLVKTILLNMPEYYEKAAALLGLDEHITIEVVEKNTVVTGTIHR